MTKAKASKPREIGFNQEALRMAVNSDVQLAVCRYEQRKVARRMFSVFDQLATNGKTVGNTVYPPTLTKAQAVAGNNMFALYAAWKGLAGTPDGEDVGYIDGPKTTREMVTDRMIKAGREWRRITTGIDENDERVHDGMTPGNAALLAALCHDMLISDGAMIDTKANTPKVRWREIVKQICGINDRDCQRDAVKRMCVDLEKWVR